MSRKNQETILEESKLIESLDYLKDLLNSISSIALILNEERQIIYANDQLLELLGKKNINSILSMRPGEAFQCIYSNPNGCEEAKECKYCNAANTVLESQRLNKQTSNTAYVFTESDKVSHTLEINITATPFHINNHSYTIVNIVDISSETRVKELEKIFFHDIANKASTITGLTSYIMKKETDIHKLNTVLKTINITANELLDELYAQRDLKEAETNELSINFKLYNTLDIAVNLISQFENNEISEDKKISLDENFLNINFKTDYKILNRVLTNLLKNAIEASNSGDEIIFGSLKKDSKLIFWIENSGYIDETDQAKIFKKRFSTKHNSRGLGTYSIKLLTEKYLKGKVYFISTKNKNTQFFIELDINHK